MKYRDRLVQQIKEAGQEIIDRAEAMVSEDTDVIVGFKISIKFTQGERPEIPIIKWKIDVGCKRTIEEHRARMKEHWESIGHNRKM